MQNRLFLLPILFSVGLLSACTGKSEPSVSSEVTLASSRSKVSYVERTEVYNASWEVAASWEVWHTRKSVAVHASKNDCWVIVNGGVYDITAHFAKVQASIPQIGKLCGTELDKQITISQAELFKQWVVSAAKIGIVVSRTDKQ